MMGWIRWATGNLYHRVLILTIRADSRTWLGAMIVVSYAAYVPVILFALQVPMLGMLMIPKILAYLA